MPNLQTLSIQNCTGLTADIDLTMCPNITQVDASDTNINVLVPTQPVLTKYELGAPTEISLDSPTVLQPSGVNVGNYANLDSLDLVNIPNNKSFTMFDKVMKNLGGYLYYGFKYDWGKGHPVVDLITSGNTAGSSYIDIPTGHDITVQVITSPQVTGFYDDIYNANNQRTSGSLRTLTGDKYTYTNFTGAHMYISTQLQWQAVGWSTTSGISVTVTDDTTGDIIFKSELEAYNKV